MDIAEATNVNEIKGFGDEIRMENIRNRKAAKFEGIK